MPLKIFYSYSHRDEELRLELEKSLSLLQRRGLIVGWHDRRIDAGEHWASAISSHVQSADIILLLISADFLASDYCWGVEMKLALERHARQRAIVVPIILRPVDWSCAPFAELQALPRDAKPVTTWINRDEALADIAKGIRKIAERAESRETHDSSRPGHQEEPTNDVRGSVAREADTIGPTAGRSDGVSGPESRGDGSSETLRKSDATGPSSAPNTRDSNGRLSTPRASYRKKLTVGLTGLLALVGIIATVLALQPEGRSLVDNHTSQYAYIASGTFVSVLDASSLRSVARIDIPEGRHAGIKVAPDGFFLFVPNEPYESNGAPDNTISIVNLDKRSVATISVGNGRHVALAFERSSSVLYMTDEEGFLTKAVFHAPDKLDVVARVRIGKNPSSIALTPDQSRAYVSSWDEGTVSVVETAHMSLVGTVNGVGDRPSSVVTSAKCNCAFVPSYGNSKLSIVSLDTNLVEQVISLGSDAPLGAVLTPDERYLYLPNDAGSNVEVVDVVNRRVQDRIGLGRNPSSIAITENGRYAFVVSRKDNSVSQIDTAAGTTKVVLSNLAQPFGISLSPFVGKPSVISVPNKLIDKLLPTHIEREKSVPLASSSGPAVSNGRVFPERLTITEPTGGVVGQNPSIEFKYENIPYDHHLWLIVVGDEPKPASNPDLYWPIGHVPFGDGLSVITGDEIARNDPKPHTWRSMVPKRNAWFSDAGKKYRLELIAVDGRSNERLGREYEINAKSGFPGVSRQKYDYDPDVKCRSNPIHVARDAPQ